MFKINIRRYVRLYNSQNRTMLRNKLTLYGDEASPPVRFVLMTASALNIELDYHEIDLFSGQHKTEFYKKINPLQKVPALIAQDQVICDSHAISMYLCQQHDDKALYSSEPSIKARIDEMLFFNSGTLFPIDSAIFTDYFSGKWPVDPSKLNSLNAALDYLELNLTKNSWLTGDKMRLCDICLMATVTSIYQIVPRASRHKNVEKWLKRFETLPFYHINKQGLRRLLRFIKSCKSKIIV